MEQLKGKVKIAVKKKSSTNRRKNLEIAIEVDKKIFQGTDWLESLNRIESLERYLKNGNVRLINEYIESAKEQLVNNKSTQNGYIKSSNVSVINK